MATVSFPCRTHPVMLVGLAGLMKMWNCVWCVRTGDGAGRVVWFSSFHLPLEVSD